MGDLSRAGTRLKGFCRTNLFKRLESSGHAFVLSLERHILRNFICLHAIENDLPLPIGTQDTGLLDTWANDEDSDLWDPASDGDDDDGDPTRRFGQSRNGSRVQGAGRGNLQSVCRPVSEAIQVASARPVRQDAFAKDLRADAKSLMKVLKLAGDWDPGRDAKLSALIDLVQKRHPNEKVLVFTQFADTVDYLAGATSGLRHPFSVWRHRRLRRPDRPLLAGSARSATRSETTCLRRDELRVVVATDVLSEGQNLQDCAIIVNYDLPWAIIRLIQRAGRVDRIGQQVRHDTLLLFPASRRRGADHSAAQPRPPTAKGKRRGRRHGRSILRGRNGRPAASRPLHEKAGILDGDDDTEVDLASYAYQIWKNAIDADPGIGEDHSRGCRTWFIPPSRTSPMHGTRRGAGLPAHRGGQ